jgi:negative regulator of sigma E activity
MNQRHKELLSAFMDGELSELELTELSEIWAKDDSLVETARSFQLVGDALHSGASRTRSLQTDLSSMDLFLRVRGDLIAEPAPHQGSDPHQGNNPHQENNVVPLPTRPAVARLIATDAASAPQHVGELAPSASNRFARPVIGLAIAATITMASIGALRLFGDTSAIPTDANPAVADAVAPPVLAPERAPENGIHWTVSTPGVEQRLNLYLVNHSELSRGGMHGVLPYARVVGYREKSPDQ